MKSLLFSYFNFLLLLVILTWKARPPLRQFLVERRDRIRTDIEAVSQLLSRAKLQKEEFAAKLKAVDAEASALRQSARSEAEQLRQKVVANSKLLAARIVDDSYKAAVAAGADLRVELRAEMAQRIVRRAEDQIQESLTGDARARIRQEFSQQVETVA